MDKETLSNYGWIVICVMVLAVMLALASPFGNFVADAIKSTTQGLFDVNQNALDSAGIQIMEQEFDTMLNGNNGAVVPDGFTYTDAMTGDVLGSGQQVPTPMNAGSQLTQTDGDYIYTLMQTGFKTLEEARGYYRVYCESLTGLSWEKFVEQMNIGSEEDTWALLSSSFGIGLTEDTFVADDNPSQYWSVVTKNKTKSSYASFCGELLGRPVTDMSMCFYGCENLESVPNLPASITSISSEAFSGCLSLTSIDIPYGITSIGDGAFSGCSNLVSVDIPNTVTSLGGSVFWECTSLKEIVLPDSISEIGSGVFYYCTSLEKVVLSDSLTYIYGFDGCSKLSSIVIPACVKNIYVNCFADCTALSSISFDGTINDWNTITLGPSWNKNIPADKVICSNGEVSLS